MRITININVKNKKDKLLILSQCFNGILDKVINDRPSKNEGAVGGFFETRNINGAPKKIISDYRITKS